MIAALALAALLTTEQLEIETARGSEMERRTVEQLQGLLRRLRCLSVAIYSSAWSSTSVPFRTVIRSLPYILGTSARTHSCSRRSCTSSSTGSSTRHADGYPRGSDGVGEAFPRRTGGLSGWRRYSPVNVRASPGDLLGVELAHSSRGRRRDVRMSWPSGSRTTIGGSTGRCWTTTRKIGAIVRAASAGAMTEETAVERRDAADELGSEWSSPLISVLGRQKETSMWRGLDYHRDRHSTHWLCHGPHRAYPHATVGLPS